MGDNKDFSNSLTEAHFCGLQSQSNVYGLCKIDLPSKQSEILVSSLRGKVVSLRFNKTKPISREIRFTYIPGDADIISIDAFNKFHHCSSVVIGVTFTKVSEGKSIYYLNVYSEWEQSADFNLDSIAQVWHTNELNFTPYQLYHTEFVQDGNVYIVFLLSGSDRRVHMFKEDKYTKVFTEDCECEKFYPEFSNLVSNVTWLQCEHYQDFQKRITAVGYVSGVVKVDIVDTHKLEIISSWTIQHDSPITSLRLFPFKTDVECPHFVTEVIDTVEDPLEPCIPDFNLLVNSAVEPSVVYRSVIELGLCEPVILEGSEKYDCVLCGCVADVDLDGSNEVVIGTYGQEMLAYKFYPTKTKHHHQTVKQNTKEPMKEDICSSTGMDNLPNVSRSIKGLVESSTKSSDTSCTKEAGQATAFDMQNLSLLKVGGIQDENQLSNKFNEQTADKSSEQNLLVYNSKNDCVPQMPNSFELNLSERNDDNNSVVDQLQSPLTFHSGHFNSEQSLSPLIQDNDKLQTEPQSEKIKTDIANMEGDVNNVTISKDKYDYDGGNNDKNKFEVSKIESHDDCKFLTECIENFDINNKDTSNSKFVKGEYKLLWKHSFADPVFAINSMDIAGDGLEELVVLTQKGVHILQHDIDQVAELCLQRLKQATLHETVQEDVFKQLLSENLASSYHDDLENE